MSFKQLKKQFLDGSNTNDIPSLVRAINNLQVNVGESLQPLISKFQNDSIILNNINLKSGTTNNINHHLNKILSGWSIIELDTNSNIWRVNNKLNQNLILYLQCSFDCTVSLLVF